MHVGPEQSVCFFCPILTKLEPGEQILVTIPNIDFH